MADGNNDQCRRNCWWAAAVGGVLIAVLLLALAGFTFVAAILSGVVFAILLGFFLGRAFCSATGDTDLPAPLSQTVGLVAPAPGKATEADKKPLDDAAPGSAAGGNDAKAGAAVKPARKASPKPATKPKAKPASRTAKPAAAQKASSAAKPVGATATALDAALAKAKDAPDTGAPEMLASPRGGKADDLKLIKGVGPALEKLLNEAGVWHFDQIASWKAKEIAYIDGRMARFSGRISRDEWVKQARILAGGGATEFSARGAVKGDS